MQFTILCVGKCKEKYFTDGIKEYQKRMSKYGRVNIIEVPDEKTPDHASENLELQIKGKEAERLMKHISDSMYVIALDLRGQQYDSVAFSKKLSNLKVGGKSHIAFVIGGSLGIHPQVLSRADESISFSKMTFPHQLMRLILMEQLYRAMRIECGEPYHK